MGQFAASQAPGFHWEYFFSLKYFFSLIYWQLYKLFHSQLQVKGDATRYLEPLSNSLTPSLGNSCWPGLDTLNICFVWHKHESRLVTLDCFISVSAMTQMMTYWHHEQDNHLRCGDGRSGRTVLWIILGLGAPVEHLAVCLPCLHRHLLHHPDNLHGHHLQTIDSTTGMIIDNGHSGKLNIIY